MLKKGNVLKYENQLIFRCPVGYLKSIHILKNNFLLIDAGDYLGIVNNNGTLQKKELQLDSEIPKIIKPNKKEINTSLFKMININEQYYIKRVPYGLAIFDVDTFQIYTTIAGPTDISNLYVPSDILFNGVYLYFGDNGNVYCLE